MVHKGLAFCGNDWSDAFCITKSIQLVVSLLTFLLVLHDFIIRFFRQRQFNFFFIVCIEMMIALLSNMIFTLDHSIYFFNYFEGFAFNIYFATIVYQVALKLIKIKQSSQHYKLIFFTINGCLIGFILFLTIVLILRILYIYNDCEEIWFLVVNFFGIVLSIIMVFAGKIYTKHQQDRISGLVDKNIKNPKLNIWKWIIINISCQIMSFLQSLIFISSPLGCKFSQNYTANEIIKLMFQLFSFHIGMIATVYFFRGKYNQDQEKLNTERYSSTMRDRFYTQQSKEIQLTSNVSNPKVQSNQLQIKRISSFFQATKDKQSRSSLNAVNQPKDLY